MRLRAANAIARNISVQQIVVCQAVNGSALQGADDNYRQDTRSRFATVSSHFIVYSYRTNTSLTCCVVGFFYLFERFIMAPVTKLVL